jgi:hypothetical protein
VLSSFNGKTLGVAVLDVTAGVALAYVFAEDQLLVWASERPLALAVLFILGTAFAVAGAVAPKLLTIPTPRLSWRARAATEGAFGLLIASIGATCGLLAATISLWTLLVWFFVGAIVLRVYYTVCPLGSMSNG